MGIRVIVTGVVVAATVVVVAALRMTSAPMKEASKGDTGWEYAAAITRPATSGRRPPTRTAGRAQPYSRLNGSRPGSPAPSGLDGAIAARETSTDVVARTDATMAIGAVDDPAAVLALLSLYRNEPDAEARREILMAILACPARLEAGDAIAAELELAFVGPGELEDRLLILEVAGQIPHPAIAGLLESQAAASHLDPLERTAACAGLVRLQVMDPSLIPRDRVDGLLAALAIDAGAADDPEMRVPAIMALAERREDHENLLRQIREAEPDAMTRELLDRVLAN